MAAPVAGAEWHVALDPMPGRPAGSGFHLAWHRQDEEAQTAGSLVGFHDHCKTKAQAEWVLGLAAGGLLGGHEGEPSGRWGSWRGQGEETGGLPLWA